MPQINRIRVNNVKYNFGTQSYEDFCMRFSCKNTIYDLANGGGKSLLMLLLMQNLIPNCTLDEKQPIEKLFRKNSGNTVIHSLIEWKLDECYVREQYRFMTTGFCARKSPSSSDEEGSNASIEYFNYCIFYRKFGENDIRNLPLVQNGEKITYNGLKAYLRDLEKKDFGVEVHIFEGKGEYQNFISRYGLYESEWEMIRGINKTEGHVRTYFESNYRTSRKVVEDLLIEEIIQKSFNNRMGTASDDDTMARTLMEIKGQLVELAKKHSEMDKFDEQAAAFDRVLANLKRFEELYGDKAVCEDKLARMCRGSRQALENHNRLLEENSQAITAAQEQLEDEKRLILTAEVMEEEENYRNVVKLCEDTDKKRLDGEKKRSDAAFTLRLQEAVNEYEEYLEAEEKAEIARTALDNQMKDHKDVLSELQDIAWARIKTTGKLKEEMEAGLERCRVSMEELAAADRQAKHNLEELKINSARISQRAQILDEAVQDKEKEIAGYLSTDTVLIAEESAAALEQARLDLSLNQKEIKRLEDELDKKKSRVEELKYDLASSSAVMDSLKDRLFELETQNSQDIQDEEHFYELSKVYGESEADRLIARIKAICDETDARIQELEKAIAMAQESKKAAENNSYVFNGRQYNMVRDYLVKNYGPDVVDGASWFKSLDRGQQRDLRKRLPFVEYGIIIKNDFDRILEDSRLQEFAGSSYLVPVISENVIYDTKLEVNSERIVYGTQNLDFLYDDEKKDVYIRVLEEEIDNNTAALARARDKRAIVWDDYVSCLTYNELKKKSGVDTQAKKDMLEQDMNKLYAKSQVFVDNLNTEERICGEIRESLDKTVEKGRNLQTIVDNLEKLEAARLQLEELYDTKNSLRIESENAAAYLEDGMIAVAKAELDYNNSVLAYNGKSAELEKFHRQQKDFEEFAVDMPSSQTQGELLLNMPEDTLLNRFYGLKEVYEKAGFDANDKKALIDSFTRTMDRAKSAIEYRQFTLDEVKKYCEGGLTKCSPSRLKELKAVVDAIDRELEAVLREYDSQCAMKNRIEGSMDHARNQIVERFGTYEPFECQSCRSFIDQHKALLEEKKKSVSKMEDSLKSLKEENTRLAVINKDLERIVANAGIEVEDCQEAEADFEKYEQTAKELSAMQKKENKLKDDFNREKSMLADRLNDLEAFDLAGEVKASLTAPVNKQEAVEIQTNIGETIEYIKLEKERIEGSIESLERIKENFENRCIQTCESIRSQLDRLPKMSTITLDDERISMINLHIPYVKQEQIRERMSSYIDETVTGAESFKNPEERLKYIRVRLAWKKLFSVIVTDMNAIKIELYKRERLKDQSRYLPYEEAVGSTGQSQGIYIQFFIALIHYISSVNAAEGQAGTLGKTIFIDNPFGAAKDIYIWEPIFKLLATNHVQLIVPARGATPAITGRFDVNYILGQKLVGNRQQTVVVDYHSQINQEMAEYVKMDYEQGTLNFD